MERTVHTLSKQAEIQGDFRLGKKGGRAMGKGTNSLKGKVTNKNAMYVEADVKSESKKPVSKKGGDLRAKK